MCARRTKELLISGYTTSIYDSGKYVSLATYPAIHCFIHMWSRVSMKRNNIHPSMYLLAKCQHKANNNTIYNNAKWIEH